LLLHVPLLVAPACLCDLQLVGLAGAAFVEVVPQSPGQRMCCDGEKDPEKYQRWSDAFQ
jgi:hypothetical protein